MTMFLFPRGALCSGLAQLEGTAATLNCNQELQAFLKYFVLI